MRGQKARPLVNSNVLSTNIWCKLSHSCRSLSHDWMSLDRFGQADELILLCWSYYLCMNYASPFGTDESAWDKQWCNLRPSPTAWDWQVTFKTGNFVGLYWWFYNWAGPEINSRPTATFYAKDPLALDAFKKVPSLWQSQTRHTFYISLHWSLNPWTGNKGPQRTRQGPVSI